MIINMTSNKILGYFTSTSFQLLKTNFRNTRSCNICTSPLPKAWFSIPEEDPDGPTIIRPNNCAERDPPILEASCKAAVVIGGSGCGFAAADHLLCKGALGLVILDDDSTTGEFAAKKLCNDHGQGRAHYIVCDARDNCQLEAGLSLAICKYKKIHIIFNDLDKKRYPINLCRCDPQKNSINVASNVFDMGMKLMSKEHGGAGGMIVSCASLLGFQNFPEDPSPVYCLKEPAIETTMNYAKQHDFEKTGVRLITLCPVNKPFSKIALPSALKPIPKNRRVERPPCVPSLNEKIGPALDHVMARAKNGSTWVVEPSTSPTENPRQIFFPSEKGEKIDPKVYDIEHQLCPVSLSQHSVKLPGEDGKCSCEITATKKK